MLNYNLPFGPDVSSYQPNTDWAKIKAAGATFAVVKATESTDYVNPYFATDWPAIKANGLYRLSYHFARPSVNLDPTKEVYWFVDNINKVGQLEKGDILCLDIEDPDFNGDASGWTLFFLQILESLVGFKPIIYTGPWYINSRLLTNAPKLGKYPLWNADYQTGWPATPKPWYQTTFWQFTDKGVLDGISGNGNVDLNYFNGSPDRIPLLGYNPNNAPPVVTPTPPPVLDKSVLLADLHDRMVVIDADITKIKESLALLESNLEDMNASWTKLLS